MEQVSGCKKKTKQSFMNDISKRWELLVLIKSLTKI